MKKINTSAVSTAIGLPLKSGSLVHIQNAYQEALNSTVLAIISQGIYDPTVGYILHGCINSGSGTTYTISAGAVFFNGEIYQVAASTFTITGLQVPVGTITTSYFSDPTADPVAFTDGVSRNVHEIRTIVFSAGLSGSGTVNYSACVDMRYRPIAAIGQVVQWKLPSGVLTDYFTLGVGIHPLTKGFAIADGTNGTDNYGGVVMVGYKSGDANFGTIGGTGGEVAHTLTTAELPAAGVTYKDTFLTTVDANVGTATGFTNVDLAPGDSGSTHYGISSINTTTAANNKRISDIRTTNNLGSGTAHNNLQPYKVVLFIQRIS